MERSDILIPQQASITSNVCQSQVPQRVAVVCRSTSEQNVAHEDVATLVLDDGKCIAVEGGRVADQVQPRAECEEARSLEEMRIRLVELQK